MGKSKLDKVSSCYKV